MHLAMKTSLMAISTLTTIVLGGAMSCDGGCYWHQRNFSISPNQDCIRPKYDVCEAHYGITLQNDCSAVLVVDNGGDDSGLRTYSIEPGSSKYVDASRFIDSNHHVRLPALLGTTRLEISWNITWD
jgi:hypothetical protein